MVLKGLVPNGTDGIDLIVLKDTYLMVMIEYWQSYIKSMVPISQLSNFQHIFQHPVAYIFAIT